MCFQIFFIAHHIPVQSPKQTDIQPGASATFSVQAAGINLSYCRYQNVSGDRVASYPAVPAFFRFQDAGTAGYEASDRVHITYEDITSTMKFTVQGKKGTGKQ